MEEMSKHGNLSRAALRADMDRKTARKYVNAGKLPSELKQPRSWRTRQNPFEDDWEWVVGHLSTTPELEAKTLFEALQERRPGRYSEGQLRTLQRHVREWRAMHGPEKEVWFPQEHRPGEAGQTDFTSGSALAVTINGVLFAHLLCHFVLPYSNWQWVTVCLSESFLAIKRGVQEALFKLGRRPAFHQTDNSTSATHRPTEGKRKFNDDYASLMRHLGMKPRTIAIGKKEQNGDVEAQNGVLKRRLEQALLLRGSRDFGSVEEYESWAQGVCQKNNELRRAKLRDELAAMAPVDAKRLAEFKEVDVRVTPGSTIRLLHNTYSVPSRLRGEVVKARVYERSVEVWYGGERQLTTERLIGRFNHRVNYRHVIWSLVRKPGAFARYRYREDLFPSLTFKRAYDALAQGAASIKADLDYLRILHLAAATSEADVEAVVEQLLTGTHRITADRVKSLVLPAESNLPGLPEYEVALDSYDELIAPTEVA